MEQVESVSALENWIHQMVQIEWLSTAITVAIVLAITAFVSHLLTNLLVRVLSHDEVPLPSSSIFVNIGRVAVWCLGVAIVLSSCFNVDVSAAVAALGVGGIALSLGFQDTISNLIGGLQISIGGIVQPGDHIEVGGERGVVTDVTWRHTTIEDTAGNRAIIPNSVINKSALIQLPPLRKIVVPITVAAEGAELDVLEQQLITAARDAVKPVAILEKDPIVLFSAMGDFGSVGSLIVWITENKKATDAKSAIVRAIAPYVRK